MRLRYVVSPACPEPFDYAQDGPVEGSNGWVEQDGRPTCQATLTSVATKGQCYFSGLEGLVAFLQAEAPGQSVANPAAQGREEETM